MNKLIFSNYFFIILASISFANIYSQDTDVVQELVSPTIAKNLATSLNQSDLDPSINYINYQKGLKKDLFPNSSKLSVSQNQIINRVNSDLFNSIIKSYNKAKQLLTTSKNDDSQIKNIINELNTLINFATKVIDQKTMFEEFDKAKVFDQFTEIKKIKDFLDSKKRDSESSQSSTLSTPDIIKIVAGAVMGVGAGSLAYLLSKSNVKVVFDEAQYNSFVKSIVESDAIKFNEILHELIKKEANPKPFEEVFKKVESNLIKMKVPEDFINRVKVLNDLPITQNSELFKVLEKLTNADNVEGLALDWEKRYQEALIKKDPKAISSLIDDIKINSEDFEHKKLETVEIVDLMKKNSDFGKVFNDNVVKNQILKQFNIVDLKNNLKLNTVQFDILKNQVNQLPKDSYIKINETYYKLGANAELHEIFNPELKVRMNAHEINFAHPPIK